MLGLIDVLFNLFLGMTIFNLIMYAVTAIVALRFPNWLYNIQNKMFNLNINREDYDKIIFNYVGMYKLLFIMFNVAPTIALYCML